VVARHAGNVRDLVERELAGEVVLDEPERFRYWIQRRIRWRIHTVLISARRHCAASGAHGLDRACGL